MNEKEILQLYEARNVEDLSKYLRDMDDNQLRGLLDNRAVKGKGDPAPLLRAILFDSSKLVFGSIGHRPQLKRFPRESQVGSPVSHNMGVQRRLLVFKYVITLLHKHDLGSKVASEVIGLLMLETDAFPSRCLATLANFYVDRIKQGLKTGGGGKCLELFPKILSALDSREVVQSGDNTMKGGEYKSHILNTLCSGRWETGSVIHLAAMFKDVTLSLDELGHVISKIMRMFKDVDTQELPPLVYQLLLLSTKGHKRQVLEGVSHYFVTQDQAHIEDDGPDETDLSEATNSSEQLRHIQGTVLLHMSFAIKQDQDLGRELIKYLKCCPPHMVLSPFNVALALSVSRIHRFEEQVSEFLKSTIVRCYRDSEKQEQSYWVREMAPEKWDIAKQVLKTVKNSTYGWDSVVQGLVHLGFLLMDAFGPRAAFGKVVEVVTPSHLSPTQQACQLGANILQDTFKNHEMVREEILEQILNRVVTKATAPVSHFIDLLGSTVTSAPQILLDCLPKVREAFDYLSLLPPPTAEGLLRAIHPLLKISANLRDALILVLRKAMFSRQVEARQIAVNGFFLILKHFKVIGALPTSQASQSISLSQFSIGVDVHIPYNAANNEALCLEILGNLRRALTQQAAVRQTLYQGLYDVVCRNSQLSSPVLSLLFHQFKNYYEATEDVAPPIKLEPCILTQGDNVQAVEPLSDLLGCLVQCMLKSEQQAPNAQEDDDEEEENEETVMKQEIRQLMASLAERMAKSDLEDFELDKSADFSAANTVGLKNTIYAHQVAAIYESLIEYTFLTGNFEVSACEQVLQLYQNFHKLQEIIKEKCGGGGGKKGRPGTSSQGGAALKKKSQLSIKFLAVLTKALISNATPSHQEALGVIRASPDLLRFVVSSAVSRLQQLNDKGYCDGPDGGAADKLCKYVSSMARHFLRYYMEDLQTPDSNKPERRKQLMIVCLEAFSLCVSTVCTHFKPYLVNFLTAIDPNRTSASEDTEDQTQDLLHKHIKKFQRVIMTVIGADEGERSLKEVVSLIGVIGTLSKQLQPDSDHHTQLVSWLTKLAQEQQIDDTGVMRCLLNLTIEVTQQEKSVSSLLKQIARDIHTQLGDIDQEVELEQTVQFSVITLRCAASSTLPLLLAHMDREFEDTDWVINRLKVQATTFLNTATDDDSPQLSQREVQEKSVCVHLGHMVNAAHELVQTAIPMGPVVDTQLKTLTRLYNSLTLLTKFYLSLYQQKAGHLNSRYEKLVKLSGTNLTHYVYPMITYMQATQKESLQQAADKGKKKQDKKKAEAAMNAGKVHVMKETKSIPSLIFAIEQYERFLIQLAKKSQVNLMEHFKMSTSRDFRINPQSLQAAMEAQDEEEEEEESENDETMEDQENQEPPTKKQKAGKKKGNTTVAE